MSPEGIVTVGMVGAGMVGQLAHLASFRDSPGCRVLALAELRPGLRAAAAARFGVERTYRDHRGLIADPEIDAVIVVTRRPATGPIVLDALHAGKHVLSEKPMAHTAAQAESLVVAARDADRRYAIGYMKRHDAGVQRARRLLRGLLDDGRLGDPLLVRGYCFGGDSMVAASGHVMTREPRPDGLSLWPEAPDWVPAGCVADYAWFLNVNCHLLNLLRYLLGAEPRVLSADLQRRNGRVVVLDWGLAGGVLELAEVAFHDWREGVEILFERGRLLLELPPPMLRGVSARVRLEETGSEPAVTEFPPNWSWAFRRQAESFLDSVRSGEEPLAGGADSVGDLRLAESIWRRHLGLGDAR